MKNILVIDDSALMRRVISDIIMETKEYRVKYTASDGAKGLAIIEKHIDEIDAVICDINMPNMNGLELLRIVKERMLDLPFIIFSSNSDISDTLTALELGAIEFIKKPERIMSRHRSDYSGKVLKALDMATHIRRTKTVPQVESIQPIAKVEKKVVYQPTVNVKGNRRRLVALCCSTGGPRALQFVIPKLPHNLAAPVVIVQHMPAGFTYSLAKRLDGMSEICVKEAEDDEVIEPGNCYIAKGGTHLTLYCDRGKNHIRFDNSEPVAGLKPCGNIMYNSLIDTDYDEIICVILTGMGADGTKGILELAKHKRVYVIAQDEETSTVYGMPRAIYEKGIVDEVCAIEDIAREITKKAGVR